MKVLVLDCDARVSRGWSAPCGCSATRCSAPLRRPGPRRARGGPRRGRHPRRPAPGRRRAGTGFLRWAEAHVPHARRVLISGTHCPPDFIEQPGLQWFQAKPFGRRELEALLSTARPAPRP